MRSISLIFILLIFFGCKDEYKRSFKITKVEIKDILTDSTFSIRALEFNNEYIFYGSIDHFGRKTLQSEFKIDLTEIVISDQKVHDRYRIKNDSVFLHFRAIEEVNGNLFALSIENPAKLFKLYRKARKPRGCVRARFCGGA